MRGNSIEGPEVGESVVSLRNGNKAPGPSGSTIRPKGTIPSYRDPHLPPLCPPFHMFNIEYVMMSTFFAHLKTVFQFALFS